MDHNVTGNGKREGLKTISYGVISSQAPAGDKGRVKVQRLGSESPSMNTMASIITGMLLGDASISRQGNLSFEHSVKQKEYAMFKAGLLREMGFTVTVRERQRVVAGKQHGTIYAFAHVTPYTKALRKQWYPDNKKRVPPNALQSLNVAGLAFWFMDDGCWESTGGYHTSIMLSTYHLNDEEHSRLVAWFAKRWGIKSRVQKYRNSGFLRLNTMSAQKFAQLVAPIVLCVPSMAYKVAGIRANNNLPTSAQPEREDIVRPAWRLAGASGYKKLKSLAKTNTKYPLNGEVGSYYKCRILEETNALDNSIGTSDVAGEAYVVGGDDVYNRPVIEGVVVPEEIRYKVGVDYGRDRGMAWYYLGGFALVHDTNPNTVAIKFDSL